MELISESRERSWYLVKEWVTKHGNEARIHKCVWSNEVKNTAPSINDHYTGYVKKIPGDTVKYYDNPDINVHGGVTHEGPMPGAVQGDWVGFDMAHLDDESILNPEEYAETECEKLAVQLLF